MKGTRRKICQFHLSPFLTLPHSFLLRDLLVLCTSFANFRTSFLISSSFILASFPYHPTLPLQTLSSVPIKITRVVSSAFSLSDGHYHLPPISKADCWFLPPVLSMCRSYAPLSSSLNGNSKPKHHRETFLFVVGEFYIPLKNIHLWIYLGINLEHDYHQEWLFLQGNDCKFTKTWLQTNSRHNPSWFGGSLVKSKPLEPYFLLGTPSSFCNPQSL